MSGWLQTEVIEKQTWGDTLFSLRVRGVRPAFEAGQFVRIALDIGGERVARAFSFVNSPADPVSEFYGVVVPGGLLSTPLSALRAGDSLFISTLASGFLVLSEVPAASVLWLVSTGTGIAPFLSILQDGAVWERYPRVILVHAARYRQDLAYGELIRRFGEGKNGRFCYVQVLSRDTRDGAIEGRIPAAIRDGRLEAAANARLDAVEAQVMLCGNPDMVTDATAALAERGLRKHRRRRPGHITAERFW